MARPYKRASPLGQGRALTLSCGWNNAGGDTAEADDEGEWSRKDASGGCFDEDEDGDEDGDEVDFDGEA